MASLTSRLLHLTRALADEERLLEEAVSDAQNDLLRLSAWPELWSTADARELEQAARAVIDSVSEARIHINAERTRLRDTWRRLEYLGGPQ